VQSAGYDYESAEVQFVPQYTTAIDAKEAAEKLFRLLDAIEDVDDVQTVYSNEDVPEAVLAELE
jgi:transcriptional/translational regulatory protein YebC/TACO1